MKVRIIPILTLKEYDIATTIIHQCANLTKSETFHYIKSVFGSTATLGQIERAYNGIEWN